MNLKGFNDCLCLLFIGIVLLENWVVDTMVYQKLEDIWAALGF